MRLTSEQLEQFHQDGYLVFPGLFSSEEVETLRETLPEILARTGPETVREEEDTALAKIVFSLHTFHEMYRRLSVHPRILTPVEQLLGSPAHILQTRINPKLGFSGTGWTWHQDFNQWNMVDGLREPRALLTSIFLDEVTACNAPLMVIRGSHRFGHRPIPVQEVGLSQELVAEMEEKGEIVAALGPPGTMIFLDALTVHGSTANLSPRSRNMYYMAYNSVENTPIPSDRDEHRCGRDYTPLVAIEDDCLLTTTVC
jgi:ectoine hydroxylase